MGKKQKAKSVDIAVMPQQFFLYKDNSGRVQINALLRDETLWLTQKAMAELFEVEIPAISKHVKNILADGELKENQVISKMEITAADGKNYNTAFYNLDMIIAVGYRVNSKKNNMGLTSWEGSPNRRITRADVIVAKNYLLQDELGDLRYIVIAFLDFAEHEAKSGRLIFMKDWEGELDRILEFNRKAVLTGKGKISREEAENKALAEYAEYRKRIRPLEQQEWQQEYLLDIKELEKMEEET